MGCEACCIWSLITLVAGEVENKSSSECLGAIEVEARENPSRLTARILRPHR